MLPQTESPQEMPPVQEVLVPIKDMASHLLSSLHLRKSEEWEAGSPFVIASNISGVSRSADHDFYLVQQPSQSSQKWDPLSMWPDSVSVNSSPYRWAI